MQSFQQNTKPNLVVFVREPGLLRAFQIQFDNVVGNDVPERNSISLIFPEGL